MIDNDGYVIINEKKDSKNKKNIFFKFILFAYVFLIVLAYVLFQKNETPNDLKTSIIDDYQIRSEIVRYAKNLNRFFLFFNGYDTTQEELSDMQLKANFNEIKNYLDNDSDFIYYLIDYNNNFVYTNIDDFKYKSFSLNNGSQITNFDLDSSYIKIELSDYLFNEYFNGSPINQTFKDKNIKGYILLNVYEIDKLKSSVLKNSIYNILNANESMHFLNYILNVCMFFIFLITLFALFNIKNFKNAYNSYYTIYVELSKLSKLILCSFSLLSLFFLVDEFMPYTKNINFVTLISIFLLSIFIFILSFNIKYFICLRKDKKIEFVNHIINDFKLINKSKNILDIIVFYLALLIFIIADFLLIIVLLNNNQLEFIFLYFVGFLIYAYYYNFVINFYRLKENIKNIYNNVPSTMYKSNKIKDSIFYLNNLENNLVQSIDKMVKSERMKAELITNVSHDLKTPLTSIINYVELLKKEGLNSNNANDYLNVLDQKASRLKFLIEDLFEASKLATGNIALEISKINVVDLMDQAIGELSERFIEKNIDLKFKYSNKDIYLNMDGKKIWRVFDNLLSNILKYSMPNSRAYININDEHNKVSIIFRNTSNYEIPFDSKDFFERFKRGDQSRNTEGNGLGLSIAQSIILLHKGFIDIIVDGDLFKIIIIFNKEL